MASTFCISSHLAVVLNFSRIGMRKQQDVLIGQLRDLSQAKPRNKNDDLLMAEISRLESDLVLAKDEMVRNRAISSHPVANLFTERRQIPSHRH